jgi:hypothetical protein
MERAARVRILVPARITCSGLGAMKPAALSNAAAFSGEGMLEGEGCQEI